MCSLAQVGQGLAPSFAVFLAGCAAVGMALSLSNATLFALLVTTVDDADRGKVLALVSGASRACTVVALALGGVLASTLGPRVAYVLAGTAGLAIIGMGTLVVRCQLSAHPDESWQAVRMTTAQAIRVRGLTKSYHGTTVVDALDLDIARGEVFALLGPNGAGKTTTVEILEGFRPRDGGEVEVLGADPATAGLQWRNRVGIVLQTSTGLDLLTPREVLATTAKAYRDPRDVDEVVHAVGLADKANDRVAGLSGGQRRRLDVGLGIIGRPELVFLDEPTTGFDPQARRDFWSLIERLGAEGTTILLTTHYLDEAERLAGRVGVIAAGKLLALDTPADLGGRNAEEAVIGWDEGGARHTVRSAFPTTEVARLSARFGGGEVPGLTVTRPTLEDTYLALIAPHVGTETTQDPA